MMRNILRAVLPALLGFTGACGITPAYPPKEPKVFQETEYRVGEVPELEIQDRWCEAWNDTYKAGYMTYQKTVGRSYTAFKNTTRTHLKNVRIKSILAVDPRRILHDVVVDLIVMNEGRVNGDLGPSRKNVRPGQTLEILPLHTVEFWIHFTVMPEEIKGGEELILALVVEVGDRAAVVKIDPVRVRPYRKEQSQIR